MSWGSNKSGIQFHSLLIVYFIERRLIICSHFDFINESKQQMNFFKNDDRHSFKRIVIVVYQIAQLKTFNLPQLRQIFHESEGHGTSQKIYR